MSGYIPNHEDFNGLELGGDFDYISGLRSQKDNVVFMIKNNDFHIVGEDFDMQEQDLSQ